MWLQRFASNQNFMNPHLTDEGKPYGPWKYNEIIKECFYISKHLHTSYNECLDVSPTERIALLKNIAEDIERRNEEFEKINRKKE